MPPRKGSNKRGKKTNKNTGKAVEGVVQKVSEKQEKEETMAKAFSERKSVALNPFSCCHLVFTELHGMERWNMNHYLKNGYLANKSCKDCHKTCVDLAEKPADKQKHFIHYCDPGITGWKLEQDDLERKALLCDLVLCPGCWRERGAKLEASEGGGRSKQCQR
jgi:hypothetical protein